MLLLALRLVLLPALRLLLRAPEPVAPLVRLPVLLRLRAPDLAPDLVAPRAQ